MSFLLGIPNPHLEASAGGLLHGLVLCISTCLTYVTTYIVGIAANFRKGVVLLGIGTALSLILLLGGATGLLLNKTPLFHKWISIVGAATPIVLGVLARY